MSPILAKITIEMQLEEKREKKTKYISFKKGGGKKIYEFLKSAFVPVPVDKD
ncbi:MAG: hypothetical protein ACI37R_02530 [Candidatus Avigastranaerophilus sp.]